MHLFIIIYLNIFRNYLSNVISDIAVPTFYFMSGYLFYYSEKNFSFSVYKEKIKRRFEKLMIPYFFWITLYLILSLCLVFHSSAANVSISGISAYIREYGYWHIYWDCNVFEEFGEPLIGFSQDRSSPLLFPLWFVRDLFVVSLLSPILWYCVRKIGTGFVVLLSLCYIFQIWPCLHSVSSVSFFFFSFGILLSIHPNGFETIIRKWGNTSVSISIVLSLYLVYLFDVHSIFLPFVVRLFTIFGCLAVLCISYKCQQYKFASFLVLLSPTSFVIYAGHMVYLSKYFRIIAYRLFSQESVIMLLIEYIVVPLFISLFLIMLYYSVKRLCPYFLFLLNGGR